MCIGNLVRLILPSLLACALSVAGRADAHPVAQGAVDIVIFHDRIYLRAAVSSEEVLVGAAFGGEKFASRREALRRHGDYLLRHFRLSADGRRLHGRVVSVPQQDGEMPTYELEYPLAGGAPAGFSVEQDVLREYEFAPGNPWEASYVVRVVRDSRNTLEGALLTFREPLVVDLNSMTGGLRIDKLRMIEEYLRHGILHILSGYDHLLFIAALVLAVTTLWDLVKVISAFTLAHSITLTLSVLNLLRLSENIVEPMIAASIVFVALQNVFVPARSRGTGRLCVAFFFGLFHGLGFAGGLLAAMQGMPGFTVGLAVTAFSGGVELGHQLIVLPIFVALRSMRARGDPKPATVGDRVVRYGSAGIFMAGLFYLVAALR